MTTEIVGERLPGDDSDARRSQEIHTDVYLRRGFIEPDQLNEEGLFLDDYVERSTYFYQESESREVGARLISATKKESMLSLPTAKLFSVDPDKIAEAAGVHRLSELSYKSVVEVSGLAARSKGQIEKSVLPELDPVSVMYAKMLRHSVEQNHDLWLLNADPLLLRDMKHRLGDDQVAVVGERQEYMGPPTIPAAINPRRVVEDILSNSDSENRRFIEEAFQGVDITNAPGSLRGAIKESGIPYVEGSQLKRKALDPRTLAYAAILGYSAARAVPVAAVDEFEGSVPLLWTIDVGTAIPYTWGAIETFSGNTPLSRKIGRVAAKSVGITVAAGTFIAPYAYFYANGRDYPAYINAIVAGFVGVAGVSETLKLRKEKRLRSALQKTRLEKA